MQKKMTDRTPGSYDDFVAYLGTVRTEEELFSRLNFLKSRLNVERLRPV